jgi:tetratricopeptide (TPR) repeat protein
LLEASRAYEGLTAVYYFANETLLSLYAAFRSLNLAESAGTSPELARGYTSVGAIIGFVPVHKIAQLYCTRALHAAERVDDFSAKMWVWLGTGMYYSGVGRWAAARDLLNRVIETAERLGDRYRWDDGVGNLAVVTYYQGDFSRSEELSDSVNASAKRRNDTHNQAWAMRSKVYCLLPKGQFEEAQDCLETLQFLLEQETDILDEALRIDLHGLLALVHARLHRSSLAVEAAGKSLELMAQTSPTSYLSLPGYAAAAETYLLLWENQAASVSVKFLKKNARRACKALRRYAHVFPVGQPRAQLWQGQFEWLAGRQRLSRNLWGKSLAAAEKLAMPYDQGLAHYHMGLGLPVQDPRRQEHLARALQIFEQLDATFDLNQTTEALQCTTPN